MERRLLQVVVAVAALVPILAGAAGAVLGPAMLGESVATLPLDSHFRYLSGLLLGIGLLFWSTVPGIEGKSARFRILTAIVVVGGLSRLLGFAVHGVPDISMILALCMELVITPALCLWQSRIARAARGATLKAYAAR